MNARLKALVRERLGILRISQTEADRRGDLHKGFVGDILRGQKESVHGPNVAKLARALSVTAETIIDAMQTSGATRSHTDTESPSRHIPVAMSTDDLQHAPGAIPEAETRTESDGRGTPFYRHIRDHGGDLVKIDCVREWWRIPPDLVRSELHSAPEHLVIFRITSDAMEPEIMRTDYVVIDTSRRTLEPEGIWAVADRFGLVLKRIVPRHRGKNAVLLLRSANPKYPDDERGADDVTIVGRYVARFTVF